VRDLTPLVSVFSFAGIAFMLLSIGAHHAQFWTAAGLGSIGAAVGLLVRVLLLRGRPRHKTRPRGVQTGAA
jgi:hypothetical protein